MKGPRTFNVRPWRNSLLNDYLNSCNFLIRPSPPMPGSMDNIILDRYCRKISWSFIIRFFFSVSQLMNVCTYCFCIVVVFLIYCSVECNIHRFVRYSLSWVLFTWQHVCQCNSFPMRYNCMNSPQYISPHYQQQLQGHDQ